MPDRHALDDLARNTGLDPGAVTRSQDDAIDTLLDGGDAARGGDEGSRITAPELGGAVGPWILSADYSPIG
jgi:hypothetical protein